MTPRVCRTRLAHGRRHWGARWKGPLSGGRGVAAPLARGALRGAEVLAAVGTGAAAGAEDEFGGGRGLRGEAVAVSENEEAPVHALAHLQAAAGVGAATWELDPARAKTDGVVMSDDAAVATAQDSGEIAGGGAPGGGGVGGGPGEAAIIVGEELGEEGIGGLESGDAAQPQLADEAVLQRLPEAFDAALGLRGARGDEPDAELAQDAAEVCGVLGAAQLLREGPVRIVADKDVEAIAIEGQGQAVGGNELPQQGDIAVQILGGPEVQGQDGAGGVVDGAVQRELGAAGFEPREGAGVELHEAAHLSLRAPPGAHLAASALPLGGQAEGAAQAPYRGPAEHEALDLPQLLGGMAVVEAGVGALQQRGHGRAHVGRQPAGRRPAA